MECQDLLKKTLLESLEKALGDDELVLNLLNMSKNLNISISDLISQKINVQKELNVDVLHVCSEKHKDDEFIKNHGSVDLKIDKNTNTIILDLDIEKHNVSTVYKKGNKCYIKLHNNLLNKCLNIEYKELNIDKDDDNCIEYAYRSTSLINVSELLNKYRNENKLNPCHKNINGIIVKFLDISLRDKLNINSSYLVYRNPLRKTNKTHFESKDMALMFEHIIKYHNLKYDIRSHSYAGNIIRELNFNNKYSQFAIHHWIKRRFFKLTGIKYYLKQDLIIAV